MQIDSSIIAGSMHKFYKFRPDGKLVKLLPSLRQADEGLVKKKTCVTCETCVKINP